MLWCIYGLLRGIAMIDLINSLEFVGPPKGECVAYTSKQTAEAYQVTWYAKGCGLVCYNILATPELIAATALIAQRYNKQQIILTTDEIITELSLADTIKYHIEFIRDALISCLDRLD